MKKFYMCCGVNKGRQDADNLCSIERAESPTKRYASKNEAVVEAKRLAKVYNTKYIFVLEAIECVCTDEPPTVFLPLEM